MNAALDALIVGAGPAGLECARVLGERGMRRVHLVEAQDEPGGAMRWIPRLPGLGEWGRVVGYRAVQLAKLRNVELMTGLRLDAGAVADYGADIVVVATGSHWATDGLNSQTHDTIPGADAGLPHVLTPEQVMLDGKKPPGGRVSVSASTNGYFMGVSLAERLALDGRDVTLVTPLGNAGPYLFFTGEGIRMNVRLRELGVQGLAVAPRRRNQPGRVANHVFDGPLVGGRRRLPRDAARLRRRPLPGAEGFGRGAPVPDRRLRRAPLRRQRRLRRSDRLAREIDSPTPASRSRSSARTVSSARPTPSTTPSWRCPMSEGMAERTPSTTCSPPGAPSFSSGTAGRGRRGSATRSPSATPCASGRACGTSRPCTSSTCAGPTRSPRRTLVSGATSDVLSIEDGQVRFGAICDEAGKMLSDGNVFRHAADRLWVTTTLESRTALEHILAVTDGLDVEIERITRELVVIQLQGPSSRELLAPVCDRDVRELAYFRFWPEEVRVGGVPCRVSRTGYSGELGYELWCRPDDAPDLWLALEAAGDVTPYGIEALETLQDRSGTPVRVPRLHARRDRPADARARLQRRPRPGRLLRPRRASRDRRRSPAGWSRSFSTVTSSPPTGPPSPPPASRPALSRAPARAPRWVA